MPFTRKFTAALKEIGVNVSQFLTDGTINNSNSSHSTEEQNPNNDRENSIIEAANIEQSINHLERLINASSDPNLQLQSNNSEQTNQTPAPSRVATPVSSQSNMGPSVRPKTNFQNENTQRPQPGNFPANHSRVEPSLYPNLFDENIGDINRDPTSFMSSGKYGWEEFGGMESNLSTRVFPENNNQYNPNFETPRLPRDRFSRALDQLDALGSRNLREPYNDSLSPPNRHIPPNPRSGMNSYLDWYKNNVNNLKEQRPLNAGNNFPTHVNINNTRNRQHHTTSREPTVPRPSATNTTIDDVVTTTTAPSFTTTGNVNNTTTLPTSVTQPSMSTRVSSSSGNNQFPPDFHSPFAPGYPHTPYPPHAFTPNHQMPYPHHFQTFNCMPTMHPSFQGYPQNSSNWFYPPHPMQQSFHPPCWQPPTSNNGPNHPQTPHHTNHTHSYQPQSNVHTGNLNNTYTADHHTGMNNYNNSSFSPSVTAPSYNPFSRPQSTPYPGNPPPNRNSTFHVVENSNPYTPVSNNPQGNSNNDHGHELSTSSGASSSHCYNSLPFTLGPLEIDKFDGDFSEYREFKIKIQSILSSGQFTEPMKVIFLKKHLLNDALDAVASFMPDDPCAYTEMWSVLDEDFGTSELGFDHHLNILLNISSWPECKTDSDLKRLYRHISVNYSAIQHYGPEAVREAEAAKVFIVPLLTGYAANKVTKLRESGREYNIPNILKILKTIIGHSKFIESARSLRKDNVKSPKVRRSFHVNTEGENSEDSDGSCSDNGRTSRKDTKKVRWQDQRRKTSRSPSPKPGSNRSAIRYKTPPRVPSPVRFKCPFCENNEHEVKDCKLYNNRDKYWLHILNKRWCSNCLRVGHLSNLCFREQSCQLECGRADKHCQVLCDKNYKKD